MNHEVVKICLFVHPVSSMAFLDYLLNSDVIVFDLALVLRRISILESLHVWIKRALRPWMA